jgi:predicted SAM-dependent methyltransferase
VASLSGIDDLSYEKLLKGKKILHFAPEDSLTKVLKQHTNLYTTADLSNGKYDLTIDISDMSGIQDYEYGTIIACDVLEHVNNDIQAISEIHRVLAINGFAILTVPQKDKLKKTYEDSSIINPEDRAEAYGQFDHLRIYGSDFKEKLEDQGFFVTEVDENNFKKEESNKFVLFPPVLSKHPLATNYRKVFFAQKL